jgi:cation transport ATPase
VGSAARFFARDGGGRHAGRVALHLADVSCRACARRAEAVLRRTPGVVAARVWPLRERADVRFDPERTSEAAVSASLAQAGFEIRGALRRPPESPRLADIAIAAAAGVDLWVLHHAGADERALFLTVARMLLAVLVLGVGGVALARRSFTGIRDGILGRDVLAFGAFLACFGAGVVDVWSVAHDRPLRGGGFEAAAAIAVGALVARAAEVALHRFAMHANTAGSGGVELDSATQAALRQVALTRIEPTPGSWDDAATRGLVTAAIACASFTLVTQAWIGGGALTPRALLSAGAVLAGVSVGSIVAAGPLARSIALLRARRTGALVREPDALMALASIDTVCFDADVAALPDTRGLRALQERGIRALTLRRDRADDAPARAVRELERAGARVLLVGDARASQAVDVAIAVEPGKAASSCARIVVSASGVHELGRLVELGRALRRVLRQNAGLAAIYNAVLIPAAALGFLTPLSAALLLLAETLVTLATSARLLRCPQS